MTTLNIFEWSSYSCNNSSDNRLVATFETEAAAAAMAKELAELFELHAEQVQEADEGEADWDPWDYDPSPALKAFAAKHGGEFEEGLMWGDEGCSPEDLPEVTTLGKTLLLYHGYMSGGFEGDLETLIEKAGGRDVETDGGPPWLKFTIEAKPGKAPALHAALAPIFEQRSKHDNLCDWELPWGSGLPIEKDLDNVVYLPTDGGAVFTLAMGADAISEWREFLDDSAASVSIELIKPADIAPLRAEESATVGGALAAQSDIELFDAGGKSFLFTGKLASMSRAEAQARVETLGGTIAKSVNKTLDVLVIGDEGSPLFGQGSKGSKQVKAEALIEGGADLRIISESHFLQLKA